MTWNLEFTDWRRWITYPSYVGSRVGTLLDVAWSIMPVQEVEDEDRFVALSEWLRTLVAEGLLTRSEEGLARSAIGPHM